MGPTERILAALRERGLDPKQSSGQWVCRCPAHDDQRPSLSIGTGKDGRALVKCFAGCSPEAIVRALGLSLSDLFPASYLPNSKGPSASRKQGGKHYSTPEAAANAALRSVQMQREGQWRIVDVYVYTDWYRVVRLETADGSDKCFRPLCRDRQCWRVGDPSGKLPLFRPERIAEGAVRLIVEGEKAMLAAESVGIPATTSSHGAASAARSDWSPFAGREVWIAPDNDAPGKQFASQVAGLLRSLDPPAIVYQLVLPALPPHGDMHDYVTARRAAGDDDLSIQRDIERLMAEAPDWLEMGSDSLPSLSIRAGKERIKVIPASQLAAEGEGLDWLWEGFVAKGHTTLLVAPPKCGKTTLLSNLFRLMACGGELAGVVHKCKILVITEESTSVWAKRREALSLADHIHFAVRPFKGNPSRGDWTEFINGIAELVESEGFDMVVVDTLAAFSPVRDENDAADMMAALTPLHAICEAGAAVLLVHHARKSDGSEGMAVRGSSALAGFVDVVMELRRFDRESDADCRRVVTCLSRFDETPGEVVLELQDSDHYVAIGSRASATHADRIKVVDAILRQRDTAMSIDEICDAWPEKEPGVPIRPGKKTLRRDLEEETPGRLTRSGTGKRGSPYRYRLAGFDSSQPVHLRDGTNSGLVQQAG